MEIKYQFFVEENLLVQKYSGIFSVNDFKNYIAKVITLPEAQKIFKILSDFRDINMDMSDENDLKEVINTRKQVIKKQYINIFLLSNPVPTATMSLFVDEIKNEFSYNYCSTLSTAISLLKLDTSVEEMEAKLGNLKHRY